MADAEEMDEVVGELTMAYNGACSVIHHLNLAGLHMLAYEVDVIRAQIADHQYPDKAPHVHAQRPTDA
jgi:hypothetical protein